MLTFLEKSEIKRDSSYSEYSEFFLNNIDKIRAYLISKKKNAKMYEFPNWRILSSTPNAARSLSINYRHRNFNG